MCAMSHERQSHRQTRHYMSLFISCVALRWRKGTSPLRATLQILKYLQRPPEAHTYFQDAQITHPHAPKPLPPTLKHPETQMEND